MPVLQWSNSAITISTTTPLPPSHDPLLHLHPQIISAKWGKKRSGSRISQRLIIKSIALIASNLKILPEPFDSLIKELAGGGGNGGGFGFGAGGFGDGDGRRRRGRELGFGVCFMAALTSALWVVLEREGRGDLTCVFVVFAGFVICFGIGRGLGKEMRNWGLGFCCGASLVGLGMKRESLVRFVDGLRARNCSPIEGLVKKMIRRRRRR